MAAPKGNQYAKGHGKGRPAIYDEDFIENEAEALLEWIKDDSPKKVYLGSFALERGYDRFQMHDFSTKNKVFSHAYKKAKAWQEQKFVTNGLTRSWDPTFTAFAMARVCHDSWKKSWDQPDEKQEQTVNVIINKIGET